jgi:hypothetical protein
VQNPDQLVCQTILFLQVSFLCSFQMPLTTHYSTQIVIINSIYYFGFFDFELNASWVSMTTLCKPVLTFSWIHMN